MFKFFRSLLNLGASRTDSPGNARERISACMKNFQRAKHAHRLAIRRGDIRTKIDAQRDMEYWEAYLLECGAMSLEMAHPPFGAAGTWNTHRFAVRRRDASRVRIKYEDKGAPHLSPYLDVPDPTGV